MASDKMSFKIGFRCDEGQAKDLAWVGRLTRGICCRRGTCIFIGGQGALLKCRHCNRVWKVDIAALTDAHSQGTHDYDDYLHFRGDTIAEVAAWVREGGAVGDLYDLVPIVPKSFDEHPCALSSPSYPAQINWRDRAGVLGELAAADAYANAHGILQARR